MQDMFLSDLAQLLQVIRYYQNVHENPSGAILSSEKVSQYFRKCQFVENEEMAILIFL